MGNSSSYIHRCIPHHSILNLDHRSGVLFYRHICKFLDHTVEKKDLIIILLINKKEYDRI